MEFEKFRIENYRSIEDTGDCYISPGITTLAGKNEAGKTSILEALSCFNQEKDIPEKAKPINSDKKPQIHVTFLLTDEDRKSILRERFELDVKEEITEITITKVFRDGFELKSGILECFPEIATNRRQLKEDIQKSLKQIEPELKSRQLSRAGNFDVPDETEELFDRVKNMYSDLREDRDELMDHLSTVEEEMDELKEQNKENSDKYQELSQKRDGFGVQLDEMEGLCENFEFMVENINNYDISGIEWEVMKEIKERLPEFVMFQHNEDILPNKIPIDQLENNQFIQDLIKVSDFDPEIAVDGSDRERQSHRRKVNLSLNEDYEQFWSQDASNLWIDWDRENLTFWINDGGEYFEPSLRSQGRQWHLSFYLRLTAHANSNNSPIVLIDDLGIHLHEEAQKDILNKLEDLANDCKVLFTTHSSTLIDPDHLNRVRLVEKKSTGTEINKLHADAEKETLSPILSAIGAAPQLGLKPDKKHTVVVEGISDYYYIQTFRKFLDRDGEMNIIPGVGDTTQLYIGAILFGWGVDPIFFLDGDDAHDIRTDLEEQLHINEEKLIYVHEDGAIEDVFSKDDFINHVLNDPEKEFKSDSNSEYMKRAKTSKALTSKMFYEYMIENDGDVEFDDQTVENIEKIFEKLDSVLEN